MVKKRKIHEITISYRDLLRGAIIGVVVVVAIRIIKSKPVE